MRDSKEVISTAFNAEHLLAPGDAVDLFLSTVGLQPIAVEHVPLEEAHDRILAADIVAAEDHPAYPRSTMDGFALASSDSTEPRSIAGAVLMGHAPPRPIVRGEAMRIPTGGVLPAGADAVVPQEDTVEAAGALTISYQPSPGEFVTPRGSDVLSGERVLQSGRRLGPAEMGVLAALGVACVPVYRRPRIALITTGDELIEPGATPGTGQVRDSNRFALGGSLRAMGCEVHPIGPVIDDEPTLRAAIESAAGHFDGVVLSGGSSVGERDLVPRIVASLGAPGVVVHGLRVKPGKPTMLAAIGTKPVIGLPGNPTSALMMLEAAGRPLIAACTGETAFRSPTVAATAREPFRGRDGWTWYMPVRLERSTAGLIATPLRLHSAHVSLLARAHGYVIVGPQKWTIEAGEPVVVHPFGAGGPSLDEAV